LKDALKDKKIAVLMGGVSAERGISLKTGAAILGSLKDAGYDAFEVRYDGPDVAVLLADAAPDVVFVALHGRKGEDGAAQGMLEVMEIPYTGSGVLASALAMDKVVTKKLLAVDGIDTPPYVALRKGVDPEDGSGVNIKPPLVIKPVREGSTIGMSFIFDEGPIGDALATAFEYDGTVLVESYIPGRELTVSVIDGEPLPAVEIIPEGGIYDFEAKYASSKTRYVCPAELDEAVAGEISRTAARAYALVGCSGAARVDFRLGDDGRAYVLEVNTIPGMTETSLLPKAAGAAGMSFTELIEKILESAVGNS